MPRPPKPKTFELRFPGMGVVRRHSQERTYSASNYPTPWSMNVRLEDSLTNRLRGGSFTAQSAVARPSEIRYRDRVLTFSSNAITASRVGSDSDTTLSADVTDTLRPALFQLSYGGATGGTVVALVPHKDSFLVGFTADETWVQQGDPHTGSRRRISDEVGIIGADAWCVNHDTVYFMSSRGLYSMGVDGSNLTPVSEDKIPGHLIGLSDTACALDYYHADRGVYAHMTTAPSWFYDTAREGFWPFDTSSTDSHLLVGPLRLGTPYANGMIQELHGIMAASSATVLWRIVPGDTAEEAAANGKLAITASLAASDYDEYVSSSGAWDAGRNNTAWPRARSMWCCLWLHSEGSWAFEEVILSTTPFGRWR